jgi:hypothetical protein
MFKLKTNLSPEAFNPSSLFDLFEPIKLFEPYADAEALAQAF